MFFTCFLLLLPYASSLRVMTFNLWSSGGNVDNGTVKIAKHINLVNPDVVAVQEVMVVSDLVDIVEALGPKWKAIHHCDWFFPDTAIITRHEFVNGSHQQTTAGVGAKIRVNDKDEISFWSLHLDYRNYGPYAAFNKKVTNASQILVGEFPNFSAGRVQNIVELTRHPGMVKAIEESYRIPVIVAGDFNSPSDLDWIRSTKDEHGGWEFAWPATKTLRESLGVKDVYREIHPNPATHPGNTWSTVQLAALEWEGAIPEPLDRIDMIYFRGPIRPTKCETYSGVEAVSPMPNHHFNDYPSDHYAVVADFTWTTIREQSIKVQMPPKEMMEKTDRTMTSGDSCSDVLIRHSSVP